MAHRAGSADLPLHGGRVPQWLAGRMTRRDAAGPSAEEVIAQERDRSHAYGGRSVFGWEPGAEQADADQPGPHRPKRSSAH